METIVHCSSMACHIKLVVIAERHAMDLAEHDFVFPTNHVSVPSYLSSSSHPSRSTTTQ
jgi:hypothetical protein